VVAAGGQGSAASSPVRRHSRGRFTITET
jgi:hypothetical protein